MGFTSTLLRLFDSVLDDYTLKNELGEEISALEKRIYAPSITSVVDGKVESLTDGLVINNWMLL